MRWTMPTIIAGSYTKPSQPLTFVLYHRQPPFLNFNFRPLFLYRRTYVMDQNLFFPINTCFLCNHHHRPMPTAAMSDEDGHHCENNYDVLPTHPPSIVPKKTEEPNHWSNTGPTTTTLMAWAYTNPPQPLILVLFVPFLNFDFWPPFQST